MPFEWVKGPQEAPETSGAFCRQDEPLAELHLWPYRSLPRRGFVNFVAITAALITLPLLAVLGTPVLWGLLPFVAGALGLMYLMLQRSYRDGELLEELTLWPDRVALVRHNPRGPRQEWQANPWWVRVSLHEKAGPVENYITLKGEGREVEIGAFLSPEERLELFADLQRHLPRRGG